MVKTVLTSTDVACLTGFLVVCACIVWALQSLGFGASWLLGFAPIAGASAGLIGGAALLRGREPSTA